MTSRVPIRSLCFALACSGCELVEDEPEGPFDSLYAFVKKEFEYEGVKPIGTYFPPGTIIDDEKLDITASVKDCFGSEVALSTITSEEVINVSWSFESDDKAGGVAGALLGVKLSVNTSKVKTLDIEVASVTQEMVSRVEIDKRTRELGLDPDCRRHIESSENRIVLGALRIEGLRLSVTTQEGATIGLDTGNLSEYLHVEGVLQESLMSEATIAPEKPVYVGFRPTTLWSLPGDPFVVLPPEVPPELEPMQRDEPALWCCDRYGRARCALDQPGTLDALCQCDSAVTGQVCETDSGEVAAAATAELDAEDPCTVITGGPTVACGATLSPDLGPNTLFVCYERQTLRAAPCETRCHVSEAGTRDYCEDSDPCANAARDGANCGTNLAPEPWAQAATLYECLDRRTVQQTPCTDSCVTGGMGLDDFCYIAGPLPGPGSSPPGSGSSGRPPQPSP